MKFNWAFFRSWSWSKLRWRIRWRIWPNPKMEWRDKKLLWVEPSFTFHSLKRLSQRIQKPRRKVCAIDIGNRYIVWPVLAKWIDPKLIKICIEDIKKTMKEWAVLYSKQKDSLAVKWKIAVYIVSPNLEIITLYKKFERKQEKEEWYLTISKKERVKKFWL